MRVQGLVGWRADHHPYVLLSDVGLGSRFPKSLREAEVYHVDLSVSLAEPQHEVVNLDIVVAVPGLMQLPQ